MLDHLDIQWPVPDTLQQALLVQEVRPDIVNRGVPALCLITVMASQDLRKINYQVINRQEAIYLWHLEDFCCPPDGFIFVTRENADVEQTGLDQVDTGEMNVPEYALVNEYILKSRKVYICLRCFSSFVHRSLYFDFWGDCTRSIFILKVNVFISPESDWF